MKYFLIYQKNGEKFIKRFWKGEIHSSYDDPYYRANGTVDYTKWEARPWYDEKGTIGGLIIYTEIINEWKSQLQALKTVKKDSGC